MSDLVYTRDAKKPVYLSNNVMRWLWLISKSSEDSVDQLAESMIANSVAKLYPEAVKGLQELDALEKEIVESLKAK